MTDPEPFRGFIGGTGQVPDMSDSNAIREPDTDAVRRLVSPNGFDGDGPVPEKVTEAARTIARLWMSS